MLISFIIAFIKVTVIFVVIFYSFPMKKSWQRGLVRGLAIVIMLSINIPFGVSSAYMTGYFIPFTALPLTIIYFVFVRPKLKKRYRTSDSQVTNS